MKGEGYTWSRCTKSDDGDPYKMGDNKLRFPFDRTKALTEIELAFNDPTTIGQFTELEFENINTIAIIPETTSTTRTTTTTAPIKNLIEEFT